MPFGRRCLGQRLLVVFIHDLIIDVFVLVVFFSWNLMCVEVYTGKAKLHSDAGTQLFCLGGVGWDEAFLLSVTIADQSVICSPL